MRNVKNFSQFCLLIDCEIYFLRYTYEKDSH